MKRKILVLLSICVLSFPLVACSNKENTQTEKLPKEESQKEEILFDKEVIIVEGDITVIVKGKSKLTPWDSAGYMYEVSNMSDEDIELYVKDVKVDGVECTTNLDESIKMEIESLTSVSARMRIDTIESDIDSLEDLKNTTGTFCIKTNKGVEEYKFELE